MIVEFREYVGVVRDFQVMLIAETDSGLRESVLFTRSSFYLINRWIAEKKLLWKLKRKVQYIEK